VCDMAGREKRTGQRGRARADKYKEIHTLGRRHLNSNSRRKSLPCYYRTNYPRALKIQSSLHQRTVHSAFLYQFSQTVTSQFGTCFAGKFGFSHRFSHIFTGSHPLHHVVLAMFLVSYLQHIIAFMSSEPVRANQSPIAKSC